MKPGYSETPLAKKLGIKPGFKIRLFNQPDYYYDLFSDLPEDIKELTDKKSKKDFIHCFAKSTEQLNKDIKQLRQEIEENAKAMDSWIKSTDQEFYKIEYAWRKGSAPKRGRFNPDFFIKIGKVIMVIEIKGDEEIANPTDENKAEWKAAKQHFKILNEQQKEMEYHFNFLTPEDYDYYFDSIRKRKYQFTSKLDAELEKNGIGK